MKLIIDHKKFGCKAIFQEWMSETDGIKDILNNGNDESTQIVNWSDKRPLEHVICDKNNSIMNESTSASIGESGNTSRNASSDILNPQNVSNGSMSKISEYECKTCFRTFRCELKWASHHKSHTKLKSFVCDICQKRFYNLYHLKNHMRKHDGRTPYKCKFCCRYFTTASGLSVHSKKHIGSMQKRCQVCQLSFPTPYHLKNHMIRHTKKKVYKCMVCQKHFSRRGSLSVHQRLHSTESPRFKCAACPKRFHWHSNLKAHQVSHSNAHARCNICKRKFLNAVELDMHAAFHSPDVRFECIWCHKCYTSRDKLHYHIINSHVRLPAHQCDQCDRTFKFSKQLQTHRIVHTDMKPRCYVCNKTFLTKYNLQSHSISHVSNKSFECDICGIKFTYKRNLYIHLKRHVLQSQQLSNNSNPIIPRERKKRMKKLQCDICGREFAYQKSLTKCDHKKIFSIKELVNQTQFQQCEIESEVAFHGMMARTTAMAATATSMSHSKADMNVAPSNNYNNINQIPANYLIDQQQQGQQEHAMETIKIKVDILLNNAELPCQPLWELHVPNEASNLDNMFAPITIDPVSVDPPNPVLVVHDSNNTSSISETASTLSSTIETINNVCNIVSSETDCFYYPTDCTNAFHKNEANYFSMEILPATQTKHSTLTTIHSEERDDYNLRNVCIINNVMYQEL